MLLTRGATRRFGGGEAAASEFADASVTSAEGVCAFSWTTPKLGF